MIVRVTNTGGVSRRLPKPFDDVELAPGETHDFPYHLRLEALAPEIEALYRSAEIDLEVEVSPTPTDPPLLATMLLAGTLADQHFLDCQMIVPTDLSRLPPDESPIEDLTNMALTGMVLAANQRIYCYGVDLPYANREYKGRLESTGYTDGGEARINRWTQLLLYNTSGAQWVIPECTLTLTRDGDTLDALLPDLILENGQAIYLWVSATGSVYTGTASAPDWNVPLRVPSGAIVPAELGVYYDPGNRFLTQGASWKLRPDIGTVVLGKHGLKAHAVRDADGIMIAGFSYDGTPPDEFKVQAMARFCDCDGSTLATKPFAILSPIVIPGLIDANGVVTPPATPQTGFSVMFSIPEVMYDEGSRMVELQLLRMSDDPADTAGVVDNIGIGTFLVYREAVLP